MTALIPPKAPNLLISPPTEYEAKYQEQLNNALRLYFNQIDNGFSAILGGDGGSYFGLPCIGASDSTDQYAPADNTPVIVKWNTLDFGNGFTLNPAFTATAAVLGFYKIDYSLQFVNTDNAAHDVTIWLKVNGSNVSGSASKITVPARKSAGNPSYLLAYSTVPFQVNANDEIGLWWATDKAYNSTGPIDGIYMEYEAAQTVPFVHPSVPSAIGAITFVSALPT